MVNKNLFISCILIIGICIIPIVIILYLDNQVKNELILNNFKNRNEPIFSYHGKKSSIFTEYSYNIFNIANQSSIHIKSISLDWCDVKIFLNNDNNNWKDFKNIEIGIYGNNSKNSFNIIFEDKEKKNFIYQLIDNWKGWKNIVIPLKNFKSRKDWLPTEANINYIIDYPISYLQYFMATNGYFDLYFDYIKVTKK